MILVDTTVWVDHLRATEPELVRLLEQGAVLAHPWVVGELSLGSLARRREVLGLLRALPQAELATAGEIDSFVDRHDLWGLGIGYVDVALLAATRLTPDTLLWTRDRSLAATARRLGVVAEPAG